MRSLRTKPRADGAGRRVALVALGLLVALGSLALSACSSGPAPTVGEPPAAHPVEPSAAHPVEPSQPSSSAPAADPADDSADDPAPRLGTARATCTLGPARVLPVGSLAPSAHVAIAASARRAGGDDVLVAVDGAVDGDAPALVLARDGAGEPRRVALTAGESLFGLETVARGGLDDAAPDQARFALLTTAPCEVGGHTATCMRARGVWPSDGELVIGDATELAMPGPITSVRLTTALATARDHVEPRLYVARAHRVGTPALDTLVLDDASHSVRASTRLLGDGVLPEDEAVEMLALAAEGARYALFWRHGAVESHESHVMMTTPLDEHGVGSLHEVLVIESMAFLAGELAMVAAFEFAEPSWVRLGLDGEPQGEPRSIAAGEALPFPFTERRVGRLDGDPPRSIEVRDGAGHAIAPAVALDPGVRTADLARSSEGFLVAAVRGSSVALQAVRCTAR